LSRNPVDEFLSPPPFPLIICFNKKGVTAAAEIETQNSVNVHEDRDAAMHDKQSA